LVELGRRIRAERIAADLKQQELAERAAISADTVSALENGRPVSTEKLVRVLRVLDHADALENMLPPPVASPIDLQKLAGKPRRRVR
jgi:transcriptional regulator with XRE-family HTH domain